MEINSVSSAKEVTYDTKKPEQSQESTYIKGINQAESMSNDTVSAKDQMNQELEKKDQQVDQDQIRQALELSNNRNVRTRCEFAYHDDINRVSIKIFNNNTNELLREVPAEETLEMIQKIFDLAGFLVDERR